jgi:hypothetical protein
LIIKQSHVAGLVANIVNIQLILPEVKTLINQHLPLINHK